jgi:hypothetical protein
MTIRARTVTTLTGVTAGLALAVLASANGVALTGPPTSTTPIYTVPPMTLLQSVRVYYANPLRYIHNLRAMRIDEGVDYAGSGPVTALGAGDVTVIDRGHSRFWGNVDGNVVVEEIELGPLAGLSIYTAENCTPNPNLRVGQYVTSTTTLCYMHDHFPETETGFARQNLSGVPAAWSVYRLVRDGSRTAYGLDFSRLLGDLGAPKGNTGHGHDFVSYHPWVTVGVLPAGFPRF